MKATSVGTIIFKDNKFLMGRATRTGGRHDIFKGCNEEGESYVTTCLRELKEESSIITDESNLESLGLFDYNREKNLMLYKMKDISSIPDFKSLSCTSMVKDEFPEMDSYRWVTIDDIKNGNIKIGKKLKEILIKLTEEVL